MTEAKRLFHGRGQSQQYNIDWIPPYILIDSFEDLSEELLTKISLEYKDAEGVFYRNRKKREPFISLKGDIPETHFLIENELKYEVSFKENQNIGFFMDMKPGRELVAKLCEGKKVLNLFAYTCSFSVVAINAGASKVTNIDMKKSFLNVGLKNHQINDLSTKNVQFLSYDIMKSLSGIGKKAPWDIIIIDPPSNQRSFKLEQAYPRLLEKSNSWLSETGKVLACLNTPFLKSSFLKENSPAWKTQEQLYGGFEEKDPEEGLKMLLFGR